MMVDRREVLAGTVGAVLLSRNSAAVAETATAKRRQIFGIGGNFWPKPNRPPLLVLHLLGLTAARSPRICMLATATGDNPFDIELFYREFGRYDCRPAHLSLMSPVTLDFEDYLSGMDIIYVGGGATKNLMAMWQAWGLDKALKAAWNSGVVLSGTSAGSICWFENCITDSFPPKLLPLTCTGFLQGSACTHYDQREDRPTVFRQLIANGTISSPGYATDNDVALHFVDDRLHEVVTARAGANGYLVSRTADGTSQTVLPARLLS